MKDNNIYRAKYRGYLDRGIGIESDEIYEDVVTKQLYPFDYLVYSYQRGDYCGDGYAIFKKDGMLYLNNLSHCSCYGPEEKITDSESQDCYDSIENILINCSDEVKKDIEHIVAKIKELEEEIQNGR